MYVCWSILWNLKSHEYLYLVSRRLYISLDTSAPAQWIRLKFRNYWSEWSKNWCAHVYLLSSLVSYFSWSFYVWFVVVMLHWSIPFCLSRFILCHLVSCCKQYVLLSSLHIYSCHIDQTALLICPLCFFR